MTHDKTQWPRAAGQTVGTHGTHRSLRVSSGDEMVGSERHPAELRVQGQG